MAIEPTASTIEYSAASAAMAREFARRYSTLMTSNSRATCGSCANACTTFMPEMCSCRKAFMRASRTPDVAEGVAHPAAEIGGDREQHGRRAHREQRQPPVDARTSRPGSATSRTTSPSRLTMPGREHLVQRLDVVGHPGHQPPDRRAIEERRRQRHHVAVDAHAQVVHAQLADDLREVELRERGARTGRPAPAGTGSRGDRGRRAARRRCARRSPSSAGTAARSPAPRRPAAARSPAAAARGTARRSRRSGAAASGRARCRGASLAGRPSLTATRPLLGRAARGTATRTGRPRRAARACVPVSATRPPSSTRIWSASFTAATRCEIRIDVRPAQDRPQARQDRRARSRRRPTTASRRGSGSAGRRPARAPAPRAAAARPTG